MEAILWDRIKAPDAVGTPAVAFADVEPAVAALPEPTAVASSPPAKYPAESLVVVAIPNRDVDAWGFAPEEPPNVREIASEMRLVRPPGEDLGVLTPRRTWRDRLRGSISKQWTIVAGLLAAALITVGAISLRGEPTPTMRRSFEALGLMPSRPPVQRSSAVRARLSTEAEIRSPAIKSDEVPVVGAPRANERPNPATNDRTTPMAVAARDVTAPLTWPIVMSPDTLEELAEPSHGVSTPAQLLSGGAPEYPAALRTTGIGGSVEVRFTIASNGEVLDVRATSGPPQLRSIAEAAVRRWRYQAARVEDRPVETQTSITFDFDPSKIGPH
jgi:TonB family protein